MLVLVCSLASAATPLAWERDDFGEQVELDGTDGWSAGYAADAWWADAYDPGDGRVTFALSLTDHNVTDDPEAARNWLIRGEDLRQVHVDAWLFNQDDDTIGVVFGHDGQDTWYLAAHASDSAPPPVDVVQEPTLFLVRYEAGVGTLLASAPAELDAFDFSVLGIRANDGRIEVRLDGAPVLDVEEDLLPAGQVGLYAYDAGFEGSGSTQALFDRIVVRWFDDDDDGVVDDQDNCEDAANAEQADADADGLGDACDGDAPPDPEPGGDTEDPDEPDEPVTGAGGCSCGGGTHGGGLALLLLLLPWIPRFRAT